MNTQDYRVSRVVILCKDCGRDVGPYPARHKCDPEFLPDNDAGDVPPLPSANTSLSGITAAESFGAFKAGLLQKWEQIKPKQENGLKSPPSGNERRPSDAGSENSPSPNQPKWVATALDKVKAFTKHEDKEDSDEEWDPDQTAVAKALRAYYKKQGREEPSWLKIDPNRPKPVRRPPPKKESHRDNGRYDSKWSVNEPVPEPPQKNRRRRPAPNEPPQSLRGGSNRAKPEENAEEEGNQPDYMAAFARNRERLKKMSDDSQRRGDSRSPGPVHRQPPPMMLSNQSPSHQRQSPRPMERPSPPREGRQRLPPRSAPNSMGHYADNRDPRMDPRRPSLQGPHGDMRQRHPSPSPRTSSDQPMPRQRQRSAGAVMDPRMNMEASQRVAAPPQPRGHRMPQPNYPAQPQMNAPPPMRTSQPMHHPDPRQQYLDPRAMTASTPPPQRQGFGPPVDPRQYNNNHRPPQRGPPPGQYAPPFPNPNRTHPMQHPQAPPKMSYDNRMMGQYAPTQHVPPHGFAMPQQSGPNPYANPQRQMQQSFHDTRQPYNGYI